MGSQPPTSCIEAGCSNPYVQFASGKSESFTIEQVCSSQCSGYQPPPISYCGGYEISPGLVMCCCYTG